MLVIPALALLRARRFVAETAPLSFHFSLPVREWVHLSAIRFVALLCYFASEAEIFIEDGLHCVCFFCFDLDTVIGSKMYVRLWVESTFSTTIDMIVI